MFKGQDFCVNLKAVSSEAEDGPGALPRLLCCRSMEIENQEIGFKKFSMESGWPSSESSWRCYTDACNHY